MSIITNPVIYDVLKRMIISSLPMGDVIYKAVEVSGEAVKSAEGKNINEFALEVRKQEMQMEFAQHQAKVSQELAIANRINNASEVEIEEFYESVGKGKGGFGLDSVDGVTLGASGEAHRVTRRIYRFKGNAGQASELVSQQLGDEIEKIVKIESEEKLRKTKKTQ
ncbi:TPA: hypothetical protein ACXJRF_000667 [Serratia marcescens]